MRAPRQLLELLMPLKIFKAYRACFLGGVAPPLPRGFFDSLDLRRCEALAHLPISVLQLQELLVRHVVGVGIVGIGVSSTRLYRLLQ